MKINLITVLGPTAVGKTSIAARLAEDFSGEIISADSRQVYRWMDIGTGKDLDEFISRKIKYHLINIVDPGEEYNLFRFKKDFLSSFLEITENKKLPVMVGGTGLYLSAVLQNYDLKEIINDKLQSDYLEDLPLGELQNILVKLQPDQHNKTNLTEKSRVIMAIKIAEASNKDSGPTDFPKINSLNIGITTDRNEIKNKITARLKTRLSNGMIEEAKSLLKIIDHQKLQYFGLEYKFLSLYLLNKLSYNDMFQKLNSAIHNFAKRQMTWFRKMEKEGVCIKWFTPDDYVKIKEYVSIELNG